MCWSQCCTDLHILLQVMSTKLLDNVESVNQIVKSSVLRYCSTESALGNQRPLDKPGHLTMYLQDLYSCPFCWQVRRILHTRHTLTQQLGLSTFTMCLFKPSTCRNDFSFGHTRSCVNAMCHVPSAMYFGDTDLEI